jgi:hypothetical protein
VRFLYNPKSGRYLALAMWLVLLVAVVLFPSTASASTSGDCSWVDAGSGFGGWYDSNGNPCDPNAGSEPLSSVEQWAWVSMIWWNVVILASIIWSM